MIKPLLFICAHALSSLAHYSFEKLEDWKIVESVDDIPDGKGGYTQRVLSREEVLERRWLERYGDEE